MKKILFTGWFLFIFYFSGFGQVDTAAVAREVDSLIGASRKHADGWKYGEALALIEQAKALSFRTFGENSVVYANCLFNLGRTHYLMRQFSKAEPYYLDSKIRREKLLGKENADYAWSVNNLGLLYSDQGQYDLAEPLLLEAIAIRRSVLGPNDVDYAGSLYNIATLYRRTKRFDDAGPFYLESISIYDKSLGKNYIRNAWSLSGLAQAYEMKGQYEAAERCRLRAIEICKANKQEANVEYALILTSLSELYKLMGIYDKMESLLLEAAGLQEKNLGKLSLFYANTINSLGNYYLEIGRLKEAEKYYTDALEILEKSDKKIHFGYSVTLNNLGLVYIMSGRFASAEEVLLKVKKIEEGSFQEENPLYSHYGRCLHNLARLYLKMERFNDAESLFLEAADAWKDQLGKDNIQYAENLNYLGDIYTYSGKYIEAETYYMEAKHIIENGLGKDNRSYSGTVGRLASLYYIQGQHGKAMSCFLEANNININALEYACLFLSEQELNSTNQMYITALDEHFSFGNAVGPDTLNYFESCYDNTLFLKGFLLNTTSQISKLAQSDSISTEKFNLNKAYHRLLAIEYAKPIADRKNVAELEEKANTLEKELVRTVSGFGEALRQVTWQEVQAALKPGEAAIEFIRFNYYNPKPTDSVLYAALLLKPGMATPAFISLFEEKQLDALLAPFTRQGSAGLNDLYGNKAGQALYRLLWAPLEPQLNGVKTIYYSPAGLLHRLNLGAIPKGKSKETIGKRLTLSLLGSTRQLVVPPTAATTTATAAIFGGIRYDMDSTAIAASEPEPAAGSRGLSFSQTDSTLRGGSWKYLKYSDKEADNIQAQLQKAGFQASVHKGYAATEEAFKQLGKDQPSPRILHVSTHGFFFPDPGPTPHSTLRTPHSEDPIFKVSDHPMIRSGLILAGANHAWTTGRPLGNREDGILTAYEISQMDLRHTELVVLSACETGLGDIRGNEGVYGLQRAFKIAGTRNLIMSLWQVPDFQTQELMTVFYQKWLGEKLTVRQALTAAQEEMQRRRYEPFYWAGFVLVE